MVGVARSDSAAEAVPRGAALRGVGRGRVLGERDLPSRQARVLLTFLVCERARPVPKRRPRGAALAGARPALVGDVAQGPREQAAPVHHRPRPARFCGSRHPRPPRMHVTSSTCRGTPGSTSRRPALPSTRQRARFAARARQRRGARSTWRCRWPAAGFSPARTAPGSRSAAGTCERLLDSRPRRLCRGRARASPSPRLAIEAAARGPEARPAPRAGVALPDARARGPGQLGPEALAAFHRLKARAARGPGCLALGGDRRRSSRGSCGGDAGTTAARRLGGGIRRGPRLARGSPSRRSSRGSGRSR